MGPRDNNFLLVEENIVTFEHLLDFLGKMSEFLGGGGSELAQQFGFQRGVQGGGAAGEDARWQGGERLAQNWG